jgi:energy-coupling factor transport system ATP-binding protein
MIRVRNLSVRYGSVEALRGVNLDVERGECVLITGPSGCGKSTLVRALTGLIPHAIPVSWEGEVEVANFNVRDHSIPETAQRIGVVFQNPSSQLFHLRVEDEIAFGPRNLGLSADEVESRLDWALASVGISDLRERRPTDLSGGQKQRVAIAAALAMRPQVLVLDEPTASLDVPGTKQVIATLHELRQQLGLTIVLIEHRLAAAAHLADRVVVMEAGRIVAEGCMESVFQDWQALKALGLRRLLDEPQAPWRELLAPDGHSTPGLEPLLEMQGVSAGYNRRAVVEGINLTLYPGEFVALVGENGAGKSTLALVAAGLLKPKRGRVRYDGGRRPRPGLDISVLFQDPSEQLFTDSVDEEIAFGPRNYRCFDTRIHNSTLVETDMLDLRSRPPTALSVGQQQRTALGACLSLRPKLLILDEPTLGQDWGHLERLMDHLANLNRQGTTILLITHDYKLVYRYARRVILMKDGQIALDGRLVRSPNNRIKELQ